MPTCQSCGEYNEPDSKFCVSCGAALAPAARSPDAAHLGGTATAEHALALEGALDDGAQFATTAMPQRESGSAPLRVEGGSPECLIGFLVSFDANPLGDAWRITQRHAIVGRLGAGVEIPIQLPHPTVSSRHATLVAASSPARVQLTDNSSTNGTYLNDVLLQAGVRVDLRDGDRLRFGLFNAVVKIL